MANAESRKDALQDGLEPEGRQNPLLLVLGILLVAAGLNALWLIPRGLQEFLYGHALPIAHLTQCLSGFPQCIPEVLFAPMNGFTPFQLSSHLARLLFLAPGCLLIAFAVSGRFRARVFRLPPPSFAPLFASVAVLLIAVAVLGGAPTQDDDPTYLMQAAILTGGQLVEPTIPATHEWHEPFTIVTEAGLTGKYLFGEPLVLAPGVKLGFPLLLHLPLVFFTVFAIQAASKERENEQFAILAGLLLAISPTLLFTSATPVSQVPALAGLAAAVLGVTVGGMAGGLLAGTGLGLAVASRPQVGVPCGVALALVYGWKDRRLLLGALGSGLPWLAGILAYNNVVTGHPLDLPWDEFSTEKYGFTDPFGATQWKYEHTPLKALWIAFVATFRLNGWALGWPVSLIGPVAWLFLGRPAQRAVMPWAVIAIATFVFQLGYYSAGTSETGSSYHYAATPFVVLSTSAVLLSLQGRARRLGWALAAAFTLVGTSTFYLEHAARLYRLSRYVDAPWRTLPREKPTLVFQEMLQSARLDIGWTVGVPHRLRTPDEQLLLYPRDRKHIYDLLRSLNPERECKYLYFDFAANGFRLMPCESMEHLVPELSKQFLSHEFPRPAFLPDGRPWFFDGNWMTAFPWLPWEVPEIGRWPFEEALWQSRMVSPDSDEGQGRH